MFGPDCAEKIPQAVLNAISTMPDFDTVFGEIVRQQMSEFTDQRVETRHKLERQLQDVGVSLNRLVDAIASGNASPTISARIAKLEQEQSELQFQLRNLDEAAPPDIALPQAQELRERFLVALQNLCKEDQETGRLMRQLLPDLQIVPYAICDGSDIVAHAEFTLTLTPLLPAEFQSRPESQIFTRQMVVTLGSISQPVKFHSEAAALQQQGMKQRDIGSQLGLAQSAVEKALRIHRQMVEQGLTEPFIRLTSLPENCHRLRRHKHKRYRFEPLSGYPQ